LTHFSSGPEEEVISKKDDSKGKKQYVTVRVQPRAKKPGIEECSPGEFRIRVKSPPLEGRANREVIEILSSWFSLPSSCLKLVRGHKSRIKLIAIEQDKKELQQSTIKNNFKEGKS